MAGKKKYTDEQKAALAAKLAIDELALSKERLTNLDIQSEEIESRLGEIKERNRVRSQANLEIEMSIRDELRARQQIELQVANERVEEQKRIKKGLEAQINALRRLVNEKKGLDEVELAAAKHMLGNAEDALTAVNQLAGAYANTAAHAEAAAEASQNIKDASDNLANTLAGMIGIGSSWKNTVVGSFIDAGINGENLTQVVGEVGQSMSVAFSAANILGSSLQKVVEASLALAQEQDAAISSFMKATGAASSYGDAIIDTERRLVRYGVRTGEAAAATQALYTNMISFREVSNDTRLSLASTVATLGELGVQTRDASRLMNQFTRGMGLSASAAEQRLRDAAAAAQTLDIPINDFLSDMDRGMSTLAMFGDRADVEFKRIAATARATGAEVGYLMSMWEQYDTFSGAAQAAGRLNAVLEGMYVDVTALLHANPADKFRILRDALDQSGRSWAAMGRRERQAFALASGIRDMAQASQMFGASSYAFEEHAMRAEHARVSQERLQEQALAAQSVFDDLSSIFYSLAVSIRPVVEGLKTMMEAVSRAIHGTKGILSLWGGAPAIILGVVGAVYAAVKSFAAITLAIRSFDIALKMTTGRAMLLASVILMIVGYFMAPQFSPPLYIGLFIVAAGLVAVGLAADRSSAGFRKLAIPLAIVGAGIAAMIGSVALLAHHMSKLSSEQIGALVLVLGGLTVAVGLMAATGKAAVLGLGLFGAGLMAVAVPLAIIAASVAGVSLSVASLMRVMTEAKNSLGAVANIFKTIGDSSLRLAAGFTTLGFSGPLASAAIFSIAAGFGALATSLAFIKTADLKALHGMFEAISGITGKTVSALNAIASAIRNVAIAAREMGQVGTSGISAIAYSFKTLIEPPSNASILTSLGQFMKATVQVTAEDAENITKIVQQAIIYKEHAVIETATENRSLMVENVRLLGNIQQGVSSPASSPGSSGQDIVLIMNGREIGRAVNAHLNRSNLLSVSTT